MKVTATCPFCGETHHLELTDEEFKLYEDYRNGFGHVQDVLPMLNATEREFLITGYCPKCQSILFGVDALTDRVHS